MLDITSIILVVVSESVKFGDTLSGPSSAQFDEGFWKF